MNMPLLRAAEMLKEADAVIVSASNGLSITEGLHLFADNEAFEETFGDFKQKYGIRCILQGCMGRFETEEETWDFWSRLVCRYSAGYTASPVMKDLARVLGQKPYFVVTSNGEGHFQQAGFGPVFEVEGSWVEMQCNRRCHDRLYPAIPLMEKMQQAKREGSIPQSLFPRCPQCGAAMKMHVISPNFVPNTEAQTAFARFVQRWQNKKLVVLELGIGSRNQLIKAPLMELVRSQPTMGYVTINLGDLYIPQSIRERSVGLDGLLAPIMRQLADAREE